MINFSGITNSIEFTFKPSLQVINRPLLWTIAGVWSVSTVTWSPVGVSLVQIVDLYNFTSVPFKTVQAPGELSNPLIKL